MREYIYEPKYKEGEEKKFEGFIKLKLPNIEERWSFKEILVSGLDEKGGGKTIYESASDMVKVISQSERFYKEVAIKKIDGTEYKSFEDLSYDSECEQILSEVASLFLYGFGTSKK